MVNFYKLLGIKQNATDEEIKKALLKSAKENRISLDERKEIKDILLNSDSRLKYDNQLRDNEDDIEEVEGGNETKTKSLIIIFIITIIILLSFVSIYLYVYKPYRYNQEVEELITIAKDKLERNLADPFSVKYRDVTVYNKSGNKKAVICGEYNAKNKMGAYTGFEDFIYETNKDNLEEGKLLVLSHLNSEKEIKDFVDDFKYYCIDEQ